MRGNWIILILVISSSLGCRSYSKRASIPYDVFLSHDIFKENYNQYVYLIHDQDSTFLLQDINPTYNESNDTIKKISGIVRQIPTVVDSSNYHESYLQLEEPNKRIDVFLTSNTNRRIELDRLITLDKDDIQKVHLKKSLRLSKSVKIENMFKFFLILFLAVVGFAAVVFLVE